MWCHLASLIVVLYLLAPWFEGWRKRVGAPSPANSWLVNALVDYTQPYLAGNCGIEHISGWKENPQISARGKIRFGPDYGDRKLWKHLISDPNDLSADSSVNPFIDHGDFLAHRATKEDFRKMYEAWELLEAEAAGNAVAELAAVDATAVQPH